MQEIYSDVIQFRGSHYEFGRMQGEQLKNSHVIANRKKQWRLRRPRFTVDVHEVKAVMEEYAPRIWDELLGLQDGFGWNLAEILQEFGGYRIDYKKSGCSIFTAKEYMVRNYDYHPKTYEGRLTVYEPNDSGYAVIGPSQRITGRLDGMNAEGLVLGYNFIHSKQPGNGFISNMISRIVLETCKNVEEAVHLLQDIPHRHALSYLVMDGTTETHIVEGSARGTAVRKGNMCTNHFEQLTAENRNYLDDSFQRLEAIRSQGQHSMDLMDAFQMMNSTKRGIFSKQYKNWGGTIHTSAYVPSADQMLFALGGDQQPVTIDFGDWLRGRDFEFERIGGEVDTMLPFAHMQENVR